MLSRKIRDQPKIWLSFRTITFFYYWKFYNMDILITSRMQINVIAYWKLFIRRGGGEMTICSYHVTHAFQSESALYNCLNVKELLSQNRREIRSLSDCNGTWTHNHLVRKQTLNYLTELAKWLSCVVSTYLYARCVWLYVTITPRTRFILNAYSIVVWMSRNS